MTYLKHLGMIALVAAVIAGFFYFTRVDYEHTDYERHKECPMPGDPSYADCDWWPKKE